MEENEIIAILVIGLIIAAIVLLIKLNKANELNRSLNEENENLQNSNNKLHRENSKLIADNTMLEADQLKFQLQPHTLNNILAHLKLTANKLNKGLGSLTESLEYILYKGNNHLVSVEDEITFISEYLRLNELFLSELDAILLDFSRVNKSTIHYSQPSIPHLITAYFIENAFKHGSMTEKNSLRISISLSDNQFQLFVANKVKNTQKTSQGGIGLKNMKKRLDLLTPNKYEIKTHYTENEFNSVLTIQF